MIFSHFLEQLNNNTSSLNEAANYVSFSKKMSEEEFNFVRDVDPKKLEWIVLTYLKLSSERKEWFRKNVNGISEDLASWYKISNQQRYIRDGYIKYKDLKAELLSSNITGENDFEKLHNLINKLTSGSEGSEEINKKISDAVPGKHSIVYQDSSWILAEVFDHEASVFFGRHKCNGAVCVSRPDSDEYYKQYMGKNQDSPKGRLFFLRHLPYDNIGLCLFLSNESSKKDDHNDIQDNYGEDVVGDSNATDLWSIATTSQYFTSEVFKKLPEKLMLELDKINRNKKSNLKAYALSGSIDDIDQSMIYALSHSTMFIMKHLNEKEKLVEIGILKKSGEDYVLYGDLEIIGYNFKELPDLSQFVVNGEFKCIRNKNLISMNRSPKSANRFTCTRNDSLKSLKGSPKYVKWAFNCRENISLESLEGMPEHIEGDFWCLDNTNLKSLKGASKLVGGDVKILRNSESMQTIKSLEEYLEALKNIKENKDLKFFTIMKESMGKVQ